MKKLLILAFILFAPLALAQDITNHSMPIGGGPGAVGWKTGGPCTAGQALVWSSVNADPACSNPGSGATNSQATSYAAQASDCGGTIAMPASALDTLTIGSPGSFPANCSITVVNTSASRGKIMAVVGLTIGGHNILYPTQNFTIKSINSAWVYTDHPNPRWKLTGAVTLFVDNSLGSNSNDGLAIGAGAFATINGAISTVCGEFDLNSQQVNVQLTMGQNNVEQVALCVYVGGSTPASTPPTILGDATSTTTAQTYVINGSGGFAVFGVGITTPWKLKGLTLVSVGGTDLEADFQTYIYAQSVCFSTASNQITSTYNSSVEFLTPGFDCISAASNSHLNVSTGGKILYQSAVDINHLTSQNYAVSFLTGSTAGIIEMSGVTYSGTATGAQCTLLLGAGVDTGGALASIPGTAASCTATSPAWKN